MRNRSSVEGAAHLRRAVTTLGRRRSNGSSCSKPSVETHYETFSSNEQHFPRNVGTYEHVLRDVRSRGAGMAWLVSLRQPDPRLNKFSCVASRPAFESLSALPQKRNACGAKRVSDVEYKGNAGEIMHLVFHRAGPTPTIQQVRFETGLRLYGQKDRTMHDRSFVLLPNNPNRRGMFDLPMCVSVKNIIHERMMRYLRIKRQKREGERDRLATKSL